MSLLRAPHLALALAGALAVLIPWRMVHAGPPIVEPPMPEQASPVRIDNPALPTTALQGRLFFGGAGDSGDPALAAVDPGAPVIAPVAPPPLPQLVGTALGGRGRSVAILRGAGNEAGSSARLLRQGESIDGWRVIAISHASVTLSQAGQRETLQLARPAPAARVSPTPRAPNATTTMPPIIADAPAAVPARAPQDQP